MDNTVENSESIKASSIDDVLSALSSLEEKIDGLLEEESEEEVEVEESMEDKEKFQGGNEPRTSPEALENIEEDNKPEDEEEKSLEILIKDCVYCVTDEDKENCVHGVGNDPTTDNPASEHTTRQEPKLLSAEKITSSIKSKGLSHIKAAGDGIVQSNQSVSFSNLGKTKLEDYYPTDMELSMINEHTMIQMGAEDLFVVPIMAADANVDRGSEHFTTDGLKSFVPLYPGKALLLDHNWSTGSEVGKIFACAVENNKLLVKAYIPINTHNDKLIRNILAGVHCRASVGFSMDVRNAICDSCTKSQMRSGINSPLNISIFDEDSCPHRPGAMDEYGYKTTVTLGPVADVMELSFVPVPMQPAAGTYKSINKSATTITEIGNNFQKSIENIAKAVESLDKLNDPDTIISRATIGDKSVSDEQNTKEMPSATDMTGDLGPDLTGHPEDYKNPFVDAAIKELNDVSTSLKSAVDSLLSYIEEQKSVVEELKAANAERAKQFEDMKKEQEDRLLILSEIAETATSKSVELIEKSLNKSSEKNEDSTSWAKTLINNFNIGG